MSGMSRRQRNQNSEAGGGRKLGSVCEKIGWPRLDTVHVPMRCPEKDRGERTNVSDGDVTEGESSIIRVWAGIQFYRGRVAKGKKNNERVGGTSSGNPENGSHALVRHYCRIKRNDSRK